jgi:hypothetical protein
MKFQRNYCPSISQILSDESLKRLSAITAYLNLYSTGDNTSNANFRLSSSLESMKRIIISSEIETLHRKTVKEDIDRIKHALKKAYSLGKESYEAYVDANSSEIIAAFWAWMMTQKQSLFTGISNQNKSLLRNYHVGQSEIDDMIEAAIHEFITRTEGKTNLLASVKNWSPSGGADLHTWVLNGAKNMLDITVTKQRHQIVNRGKSLDENLKGKDGDGDSLGDMIVDPKSSTDAKESYDITNYDELVEAFVEALPEKISEQPDYIRGLIDRGFRAMKVQAQNAEDPESENNFYEMSLKTANELFQNVMNSFEELKRSVKVMISDKTDENREIAMKAREAYDRRVYSLLRNLVESFNPSIANKKKTQRNLSNVDENNKENENNFIDNEDKQVNQAPKIRSRDLIKPEDEVGKETATPEELMVRKMKLDEFRKQLLPYYYQVGSFPKTKYRDGKITPYALSEYGIGLIRPYTHFFSGIDSPEDIKAMFGTDEDKINSLSPTALFSRLLIESGLKAHEDYTLENKFKVPGSTMGKNEVQRFRDYFIDQIDTNPMFTRHKDVLLQMLESFFLNKNNKPSDEKVKEMIENLDAHTRMASYEWARHQLMGGDGEPKAWADLSPDELKAIAVKAWESLYADGFRLFRIQEINERGEPHRKGPVMPLSRWVKPDVFLPIMEEEVNNIQRMQANKAAVKKGYSPIAQRSRLDPSINLQNIGQKRREILDIARNNQEVQQSDVPKTFIEDNSVEDSKDALQSHASVLDRMLLKISSMEQSGDYKNADIEMSRLESILRG